MLDFNIWLFDDFETLDALGPAEIIGKLPDAYRLEYYSLHGGIVTSNQRTRVDTLPAEKMNSAAITLIPGGAGTRKLVQEVDYIARLKELTAPAKYLLTVCTGSALIAKTGLLQGKQATTNKIAFDWVVSLDSEVQWIRKARWVKDGCLYTSSGVSAGMDMTLGFVADHLGQATAEAVAHRIEYIWNRNREIDPFA